MEVVTIVGARPQFIKAAAVSQVLRKNHREILLHTGQHYDYGMSEIFFEELRLPEPDINLGIGSHRPGVQTGKMLAEIEDFLMLEKPDLVLIYGDTNSTLAGALSAAKLHIPIAHVEAGLRSFNRQMPEEINRILSDRVSDLLFCPTETAVNNLQQEGIKSGVFWTGDVMLDAALFYVDLADRRSTIIQELDLSEKSYYLATVHRPVNTNNSQNLQGIIKALNALDRQVIFPIHPRTKKALREHHVQPADHVTVIDPVGYFDMLLVEKNAKTILTDSGGIQKEAYFFSIPCITLREETEWVETVTAGWNTLTGSDPDKIITAAQNVTKNKDHPDLFGDGKASQTIVNLISEHGEYQ